MKEKDPIEQLLDSNNNENIILYDENDNKVEFEQIAIIKIDDHIYSILRPVEKMEGVDENSGLVFEIVEDENLNDVLKLVEDQETTEKVFNQYLELLKSKNNKK